MAQQRPTDSYQPFISPEQRPPEFTLTAVIIGIILAIVFGAANAYLGLIIGMTISASIPAAVISMAIIRGILRRNSILENNIVQTMTTAGEALASGAIFTLPALFLWKVNPSLYKITLIVLTGGFLGVLFMIPLRRILVVKEHGKLPYPEGTACARVLMAGEQGGARAKLVFLGLGVGGVFKAAMDALKLFPSEISTAVAGLRQGMVGMDTLPSLLGVGFIVGPRIGGLMLAGGVFGWLVLIPMIAYFGQGSGLIAPASGPIHGMDAWAIWDNYIRYIGAGAVAAGGIISLIRTLPTLWKSLAGMWTSVRSHGMGGDGDYDRTLRTEQDLPTRWTIPAAVVILLLIAFLPQLHVTLIGALGILIVGFLFVTVSARIVGIVGSSSDPVSGMTIATLLIVATVYRAAGFTGLGGMVMSLVVGAIICTALAIAGDISQDLKTGFLVGATPRKQQLAMLIGVLASGVCIGWVLLLLNDAYGFGSKALPAPKAVLMKLIVEGIMNANMPWDLVLIGAAAAVTVELLGVESLPFAVGVYLPIHTSVPIFLGGLLRWLSGKWTRRSGVSAEDVSERGILISSGLIAGESLVGILIAGLVTAKVPLPQNPILGQWVALVLYLLLAAWLFWMTTRRVRK
jgi:putative OPT family oligopeptide transporter